MATAFRSPSSARATAKVMPGQSGSAGRNWVIHWTSPSEPASGAGR